VVQLADVLPGRPVPTCRQGNGVVIDECGERRVGIIPQVKPLLLPPLHRSEHADVEIRIDASPNLT
jgi:hypothetical protein